MRPLKNVVGLGSCVIKRDLDALNCAGCLSSGKEVYTRDLAQLRPVYIQCLTQVSGKLGHVLGLMAKRARLH